MRVMKCTFFEDEFELYVAYPSQMQHKAALYSPEISNVEFVEMTEEEYQALPATARGRDVCPA